MRELSDERYDDRMTRVAMEQRISPSPLRAGKTLVETVLGEEEERDNNKGERETPPKCAFAVRKSADPLNTEEDNRDAPGYDVRAFAGEVGGK